VGWRERICTRLPPRSGTRHADGVSKPKKKDGRMSKRSLRIALIMVGLTMALVALAQHFGWLSGPPPLLAPGIR